MKLMDWIVRQPARVGFDATRGAALTLLDVQPGVESVGIGPGLDLPLANAFTAGVMSPIDKLKLDGLINTTVSVDPANFVSRAQAAAAAFPNPQMRFIRVAGFNAPGDGGDAVYRRAGAEPAHPGKFRSVDGVWWEYVYNGPARPEQFGAVNLNAGDNTQALQDWLDYLVNSGNPLNKKVGLAAGRYRIDATVTIDDPQDVAIYAMGAKFTTANDILMFDFNGRADPSYQDNESRQIFRWIGGSFDCTLADPGNATAIRALGFRAAVIEPEDITGFHVGVILGGKDTIRLADCKFFDNDIDIHFPPWSQVGGPLMVQVVNTHHSHQKSTPAIKSSVTLTDCLLRDFSMNLGSGADCVAIDLTRAVTMGVTGIVSLFQPGETVTGQTSGATMVVEEHYVFAHPFRVPEAEAHRHWLVGGQKSSTDFQLGETVIGSLSGATGTIGSDIAYLSQNPTWQNFRIEGANHFEAGSGANGAICTRLRDIIRRGQGTAHFFLDLGSVGVNGDGTIGLDLQNVRDCTISGRFGQTDTSLPIRFDGDCRNMKIRGNAFFSASSTIALNGMDRIELDLADFNRFKRRIEAIGGLTAIDLGPGATLSTKVDMSVAYNNFRTIGGLPPKAYQLQIGLTGTSSGTAGNVRFRVHHPDETSAARMNTLQIAGLGDGQFATQQIVVGADANGDWSYDGRNDAGGTVTASAYVVEVFY